MKIYLILFMLANPLNSKQEVFFLGFNEMNNCKAVEKIMIEDGWTTMGCTQK